MAISNDQKIAWPDYSSKWISNAKSREYSHKIRFQSQAILTTSKTIIKDNPLFTVRKKNKIIKFKKDLSWEKEIKEYIISIMNATRKETEEINLGASPRASLHLMRACKVNAALDGRDYVTPDDVKLLLFSVLNHRLILNPDYLLRNTNPSEVFNYSAIKEIIDKAVNSVNPPR